MMDTTKGSKTSEKKLAKENELYDAAYDLFISKGIHNTAVDDIVKKAGVAKGTFYLYFKDKYDIMDRIILKKSATVLMEATDATESRENYNENKLIENIIYFVGYIIEYFKKNKKLLKLIYKNLSWGMYRKAFDEDEHYKVVRERFFNIIGKINLNEKELKSVETTMFMVIELTGSVCYSSIILEEPDTIDNIKPELFKMISKMLTD